MTRNEALSAEDYAEVLRMLDCAHDDLSDAAQLCRPFGRLSQELWEKAEALRDARSWIEKARKRDAGISEVKEDV